MLDQKTNSHNSCDAKNDVSSTSSLLGYLALRKCNIFLHWLGSEIGCWYVNCAYRKERRENCGGLFWHTKTTFLTDIYLLSKFGIQNWARNYTNADQKVDTTLTFYRCRWWCLCLLQISSHDFSLSTHYGGKFKTILTIAKNKWVSLKTVKRQRLQRQTISN